MSSRKGQVVERKTSRFLSKGGLMLRSWRKKRGLSQFDASKELGFTYDMIGLMERGYRRPKVAVAIQLEQVAGVPVGAWLKPASEREAAWLAADGKPA